MSDFMKFNPNETSLMDRGAEAHTPELLDSYHCSTYAWQPGMVDEDGRAMKLRISKSTIGDYSWCPLQYKFKHILKLSEEETEDMVRGTNVHNIVEYFWHNVDEVLPEVLSLIEEDKELLAKEKLRSVIPDPPSPYRLGEEEVIDQWLDWQWNRLLLTKGESWKAVGNEVSAHAMLDVEINGEVISVHLRGFIDTIFSDGDGGFVLMELKTGKWNLKKAKSMREEMQFYRLMLEEGEHAEFLPVTHWAWEFPRGWANNGVKAEWEIEELGTRKTSYAPKSVMNKIKSVVKAHINDEFEPKPFSYPKPDGSREWNCTWCSFMEMCPAWNGGNEDEK
tara:strand:- start:8389 stop:9393 length:1005 start_codon:yes stop_codon:yes gene_type:complete